jgi:hypothetical protein
MEETNKGSLTVFENIQNKLNDQDFMQKVSVIPIFLLELYRVMISSFLILFVPQKCGDHVCTYNENMTLENELYSAGLVFNFITMLSFFIMYIFEIKRENRLITYLEVNKNVASDNDSVQKLLEKLPEDKRNNIWFLDKYYQTFGYTSIGCFIVNSVLSGFVVYKYYLDTQTTTTFVTNIVVMISKLSDVYSTVNTEKNVFYSAYLKGKIQFNDVDPDKNKITQDSTVENSDPSLELANISLEPSAPSLELIIANNEHNIIV